jgi:ribosomal protein L3 glutamine methyltransferase
MTELLSIRDWVRYASTEFARAGLWFGHGSSNNCDEALALVYGYLQLPFESQALTLDGRLIEQEKKILGALIKRRVEERVPVPYLLGEAWFFGVPFTVNESTLIPRSPIGELIQNQCHGLIDNEPKAVLDLCCGSGCIGILAAMNFENAEVHLSDISIEALEVANQNIWRHEIDYQVTAFQSDGFKGLPGVKYDLILSNPPYVDHQDFYSMPAEYQHEPEIALVCGADGLDLVIDILAEAAQYLNDEGVLICEVGNSWGHLEELFPEVPFMWIEFEHGGHGVFKLSKEELLQYQTYFEQAKRS